MLLADLGPEVIKVEPPRGDDARTFGPFVDGASAYYRLLNRNKLGISLDLKRSDQLHRVGRVNSVLPVKRTPHPRAS
jgi:CoA:oxalate CoA-transferase